MTQPPPPKQHIAQTLLTRAHPPETAETLFTERIKQKPLYLRPTSPTASDNRTRRRHHRLRKKEYFLRKQRPKPLSAKEKRTSGIYELGEGEAKYEVFRGLHALWVRYMQEVLDLRSDGSTGTGGGMVTALSHGSKLVSADFHGAEIEVVRSRCAGRVGMRGIVIRDTKFTFVVVTEKDEVKSMFSFLLWCRSRWLMTTAIPKEQTIIRFRVPLPKPAIDADADADADTETKEDGQKQFEAKELVFEIHGNQFQNRAVDRAHKKFKWRNVEYL